MFERVRDLFRRRREDPAIDALIKPPRQLYAGYDDPALRDRDRPLDPATWRGPYRRQEDSEQT